jgi:hypothetical protein
MTGTYIMQSIPPYVSEKRTRVSLVKWIGDRVLLRDDEIRLPDGKTYWIETSRENFIPDIPE